MSFSVLFLFIHFRFFFRQFFVKEGENYAVLKCNLHLKQMTIMLMTIANKVNNIMEHNGNGGSSTTTSAMEAFLKGIGKQTVQFNKYAQHQYGK